MKRIIFIFIIFALCYLLSAICQAQVTQEWAARYTGPSNDLFGPFLAVDKQGNSYMAGTHVINDSINILCVKYNTSGVQQWVTLYKYPGEGYFAPTGLALDSSGNAYVISDDGPSYLLPHNALIIKFNSLNGSPVWARRYVGEYGWGAFRDIKIDRLNNIYVTGWTDTSHLVIKYNTNGGSVWVRKYHPPGRVREVARDCTIDDSLNVIFTGFRRFYYPPSGYYDSVLVVKYSSGGIIRWESTYAYNYLSPNQGTNIANDQNGSLYIGGITTISGYGVYLTLKYDRNGTLQWTAIYDAPGSGDNTIYGIAMDRMNNALFVTGYSVVNSIGYATTIKYNTSTGDSAWVRRGFGVPGSSSAWDVEVDSSGNVYITGSSLGVSSSDVSTLKYSQFGDSVWLMRYNGPFNGGDGGRALEISRNNVYVLGYSLSSAQVTDYIVIKYIQFLGLKPIYKEIPKTFSLGQNYPNPFNPYTKIMFSVSQKSFIILKVYDVLGRVKEILVNGQMQPSKYELTLDASKYSTGVYFYQMVVDGRIIDTKKFIVLK